MIYLTCVYIYILIYQRRRPSGRSTVHLDCTLGSESFSFTCPVPGVEVTRSPKKGRGQSAMQRVLWLVGEGTHLRRHQRVPGQHHPLCCRLWETPVGPG